MSHVRTDQSDVRQRVAHAGTVTQISSDVIKYRLSHRHESLTATLHCNDHILAHIHFCIYTLHTHTHTHTHTILAQRTFAHVCSQRCTHGCGHAREHLLPCLCVCVCVCAYVCTCARASASACACASACVIVSASACDVRVRVCMRLRV